MENYRGKKWLVLVPMNPLIEKLFAEKKSDGESIKVAWENFIDHALYDDEFGYYKRDKIRIGGENADFYTAASLKHKVFSALIEESAKTILANRNQDVKEFEFVEIGAEPNASIIENSRVIRLGEEIKIPQQAIVISNELLDARPFARFRFKNGEWKKRILRISKKSGDYEFSEELAPTTKTEQEHLSKYFPRAKVEGFSLDISFDAFELLKKICLQNWKGVLIFADYFRTATELSELPRGTARAYFKHADFSDIAQNAGLADITFSPCSETLIDILKEFGFSGTRVDYQSNFFMEFAQQKIREIIESPQPNLPIKRELSELISPVHMGAAFRVISAIRY